MSETANGRPVEPMEDAWKFFREFGKLRPSMYGVIGGEGVAGEPGWPADRAFLHMRRGLALLLREVASRYTPSDTLLFAHAVSDPVFLREPARGAAHLRSLAAEALMGPLAIPLGCAAGVFEECLQAKDSTLNREVAA